jgi:hypothetical protein
MIRLRNLLAFLVGMDGIPRFALKADDCISVATVAETKCRNAGCIYDNKSPVLPLIYYGFAPGCRQSWGGILIDLLRWN